MHLYPPSAPAFWPLAVVLALLASTGSAVPGPDDTEPAHVEPMAPATAAFPPSGSFGTRYLEVSASRDSERISEYLGRILSAQAVVHVPLGRHWDAEAGYDYYTFSQLPSNYGNSLQGSLIYHRAYGPFTPYTAASVSVQRYHQSRIADYDIGFWNARLGVECIPVPRIVINVGAGPNDSFTAGDNLSFTASASVTLWIAGPLGLKGGGAWGETGETASALSLVTRFRF